MSLRTLVLLALTVPGCCCSDWVCLPFCVVRLAAHLASRPHVVRPPSRPPPPRPAARPSRCPSCASDERCVQLFDARCKSAGAVCRKVSRDCLAGGCAGCESEICGDTMTCIEDTCGTEAPDAFVCYSPRTSEELIAP